ncbi:MAG: DUF5702 domain-containing protein [Blautia sp.]
MKNRVHNGSITVFLSLLLVVLISLVTTSLESAHLAAVRGRIGMSSEAVMYTLFSHFEKSLYDDYKLLFLDERQDFEKILKDEMALYGQTEGENQKENNHLRFSIDSIAVTDIAHLTDNNGDAFQEEINQILASDVIAMVKNSISGNLKKLSQSGTVTDYMNQIMEQGLELETMSSQTEKAAEQASLAGRTLEDMEKSTDSGLQAAEEYRNILEKIDNGLLSETEILQKRKEIVKNLYELSEKKRELEQELESVLKSLEEYEKSAGEVASNLEKISKGLQDEELDESYKKTLHEELKAIMEMTSESGKWYQQIATARKNTENNLKEVKSVRIPVPENVSDEEIMNGNVEKMLKQVENAISKYRNVEIPISEAVVDNKYEFSGKMLLKSVQKLITEGVFPLIVDNQSGLSNRIVDLKEQPSSEKREKTEDGGKSIFQTAVDNSKDTLALNIYLTEYMDCYTDHGNYDLEYILGKDNSDRENLKSVINQMIYLRQAMNLMYLLSDGVKKQQARAVAAAMLAVTGNAALIQAMTMILLTAWAYAEAVSDVRSLVDGNKVDFLKESGSWSLSLEQAADWRNWSNTTRTEGKTGMEYKEYLRILLFFHSRNVNMFRGLDIIQWNICREDPDFRISRCVYSLSVDFSFHVNPVFVAAGGFQLNKESGFTYEHKERKKYG